MRAAGDGKASDSDSGSGLDRNSDASRDDGGGGSSVNVSGNGSGLDRNSDVSRDTGGGGSSVNVSGNGDVLMLVDGNSIINRAFFAFQNSARLTTKTGLLTNAIFGFLNIYFKYYDEIKPTHACVAFDRREPTFRHLKYSEYKANRHGMPDELAAQLPVMKEILDAMGVARVECAGYEADDILGTLARMAEEAGAGAVVVTGDRDSLQLATETTKIKIPVTKAGRTITEEYDAAAMLEKYGVTPELFIDVKGLMGDSSDNIPGVKGIGEKTAFELVKAFGGLDDIYADLEKVEKKSVREKLENGKDIAYLSRWLAVIAKDVPCGVSIADLQIKGADRKELYRLFRELNFQSYIAKMGLSDIAADAADYAAASAAGAHAAGAAQSVGVAGSAQIAGTECAAETAGAAQIAGTGGAAEAIGAAGVAGAMGAAGAATVEGAATAERAPFSQIALDEAAAAIFAGGASNSGDAPRAPRMSCPSDPGDAPGAEPGSADAPRASVKALACGGRAIEILGDFAQIERMARALADSERVAFYPVFSKPSKFDSVLFGAACWGGAGGAYYIDAGGLDQAALARALLPLLAGGKRELVGHDVKQLYHWFFKYGAKPCEAEPPRADAGFRSGADAGMDVGAGLGSDAGVDADAGAVAGEDAGLGAYSRVGAFPAFSFDTMLGGYVADAASGRYSVADLCYMYLDGAGPPPIEELTGKGKSKVALGDILTARIAEAAVRNAAAILQLAPALKAIISDNGQEDLYYNIELPLAKVLASMEVCGFKVDMAGLRQFSRELDGKIVALTKEICGLAGGQFNINSTKQLGAILYETLGLKPVKRSKTGYSTDIGALEDLAGKHPIVEKIIEYRQYVKLKSTYADGLADLVDPGTGLIHTTMNQAITATGRISSAEPNLQNIPVRLELGREIRRLFVPRDPSWLLLGADYSQIELRVLAHISEDAEMIDAFRHGMDIHSSTAAKVFGVPESEVTKAMRSKAKAVNFGIVYGIGEFSLAKDIGVTRKEAREYIDSYLARYSGVKKYMADAVDEAKRRGYAVTILNRRRSLPDLKSSNFNIRSFAERVAINTPVQGSAADVIKIAMLRVYRELAKRRMRSRLILQVHDELIIEAPADELAEAAALLKGAMEHAVSLSVPMTADVYCGPNWKDIKNPVAGMSDTPFGEPANAPAGTPAGASAAVPANAPADASGTPAGASAGISGDSAAAGSAVPLRAAIIGLTGASGSGKTEAADILRRLGATVIDADAVSREAARNESVLRELRAELGDWALGGDGRLNRKAVAERAFADKDVLDRLTAVTHRYIISVIDADVSDWKNGDTRKTGARGCQALVIDAPLPVRRGFLDNVDTVWAVTCGYRRKLERITARDGVSEEQAAARLRSQMPDAEYAALADVVIENDGAPDDLEKKVAEAWSRLFFAEG
ncbi:MAG: DNA polymerase I [Clostridiales bacterium]|jgi:DNA polymerase-1|nr:DNA polymerase I [Clostridiales bacterium]